MSVVEAGKEMSVYESMAARFDVAARKLGLDDGLYKYLRTPNREIIVHIPVFMDSRIDIYEYNGVFADYLDAIGVKNTLEIFSKYNIRYVLFKRESPVAYLLMNNAGWKVNYADGTAVLLERSTN